MFSNLSGIDFLMVFAAILFSMAVHEAMHAFTAHWLGDSTASDLGRLSLNPLKHIDIVTTVMLPLLLILLGLPPFFVAKPVPFNPSRVRWGEYGAALVGVAGPLTNLALAIIGAGLFRFNMGSLADNFFYLFVAVNIAFFVFNMIPFPPLDGSRLLYAFAPEPVQRLLYQIESMGFLAILVFMLLVFQFIAPVILSINGHLISWLLGLS
ncbi:MAG TPA: site-2 protease family protein [Candidatus Dormibacteraeota bacterium]|nr:site-2 protease family protein [Candidatus Dormibacteraeota bacterium]